MSKLDSKNSNIADLSFEDTFCQEHENQPTNSTYIEYGNLQQSKQNEHYTISKHPIKTKLIVRDGVVAMEPINGFSNTNGSSRTEHCFDPFGRYIASLLRPLPAERSFRLQAHIISTIMSSSSFSSNPFDSSCSIEMDAKKLSPVEKKNIHFSRVC